MNMAPTPQAPREVCTPDRCVEGLGVDCCASGSDTGTCAVCGIFYFTFDADDHCMSCGNCFDHCPCPKRLS